MVTSVSSGAPSKLGTRPLQTMKAAPPEGLTVGPAVNPFGQAGDAAAVSETAAGERPVAAWAVPASPRAAEGTAAKMAAAANERRRGGLITPTTLAQHENLRAYRPGVRPTIGGWPGTQSLKSSRGSTSST